MGTRNNSIVISAVLVAFLAGTIFSSPIAEAANPVLEAIQQTLGLIQTETDKIQSVKDDTNSIRFELAIIKNDVQAIKAELQIVEPPTDPTVIGTYNIILDSPLMCTGPIQLEIDQFNAEFVGTIPGQLEISSNIFPATISGTIESDHSFLASESSSNGEVSLDGQISQDLQTVTGTIIANFTDDDIGITCTVFSQYNGILL